MKNRKSRGTHNVKHFQKMRRKKIRLYCLTAIIVSLIILGRMLSNSHSISIVEPDIKIQSEIKFPKEIVSNKTVLEEVLPKWNVNLENLNSPYSILMDRKTNKVIAEKNSHQKIFPASLTKIMTAILVIENTNDLTQSVTLPAEMFTELYAENASMAGFQPNEELKLEDLLYGILLPSGAECCVGLADKIAGSEENFVNLMNQKAQELEMNDSHFTNSTGLHEEEQYTSVADMAILLNYALENEEFKNIFCSKQHSINASMQYPDGFTVQSTMFKYMESTEVKGGNIIGGKTGYTEEAGLCLASLAEIEEREYILVTAKALGTHQTEQYHISDAFNVYNQVGESVIYPVDLKMQGE